MNQVIPIKMDTFRRPQLRAAIRLVKLLDHRSQDRSAADCYEMLECIKVLARQNGRTLKQMPYAAEQFRRINMIIRL